MDIQEIINTIEQLENSATTYDNCFKLASLYTIKDNYDRQQVNEDKISDDVEQEYSDILPQYIEYVDIKRRYQLGELSEKAVETQIKKVCDEISEFIHTLYTCTDMPIEREYIKNMLGGLQNL